MGIKPKRYLVTSALPYANGPLHIGHVAGAYLNADIFVRFLRANNEEVVWVCGSDENGAAITLRAKREGVHPREIVDKYHGLIKDSFEKFKISFDYYHRTSSKEHYQNAQEFFTVLNNKNAFEVKTSMQYYDEIEKQFLADRYIMGTCPNCENPNAYGDQCEKCGKDLSPTDLINPKSVLSGESPVLRETSLWYLPMQDHEAWLKEYIEKGILDGKPHHDIKDWKKHVLGQCKSWLNDGLKSRAMTRDLDWGVPVPLEGAEGKVLYVWLDAPVGYISATKEWAKENKEDWRKYWQDEESEIIHFIGKDNIVFHCIIFPILLKAHGDYNLPMNVPANEFMNLEGDKISTSRNWAVWIHEYVEKYPDKVDEMRYVLTSLMPEQKDSEFTWEDYQTRINNELADNLGNFMNRVFVLTKKYYEGIVPETTNLGEEELEVIKKADELVVLVGDLIRNYRFKEALQEAMNISRLGNAFLAEKEPWKLVKTDAEKVKKVMFTVLQLAAKSASVLSPFLPNTSNKIKNALNLQVKDWESTKGNLLPAGHQITELSILFPKIENDMVEFEKEQLQKSKTTVAEMEPLKESISFDDFLKVDLRVGTIVQAEKIKKTDKLLKLTVDIGGEKRTIVSGIAKSYAPEDIIGKKVSLLLNLEPRKIKGVSSEGMILMAENKEGDLSFLTPDKDNIDAGNTIK